MASRAIIAIGSNLGDRHGNLLAAYRRLRSSQIGEIVSTSGLYETAPEYVLDQPKFLNGALHLKTTLQPLPLLRALKALEKDIGRVAGQRWGPRLIDLDLIMYDDRVLEDITDPDIPLVVPHPRMQERDFVLRPLVDLCPNVVHPTLGLSMTELLHKLDEKSRSPSDRGARVVPIRRCSGDSSRDTPMWDISTASRIMGILNVTPDSFSDGGQHNESVKQAVAHAFLMAKEGADIIDVGGESTRPGASEVSVQEELDRVVPVIEALREAEFPLPLSIDTRRAHVASAAIDAGASIVNDVSGGTYDPCMLETVAAMGVPFIAMHMRGTSSTMSSMTDYDAAGGVVKGVISELGNISSAAKAAGIPKWLHILDPGLGFAKKPQQSLLLLQNLKTISEATRLPLLVGASRKGFIGYCTGVKDASERDWGSVAAACWAVSNGACILRVHNVAATKQAVSVIDAIRNAS